MYLTEEGIYTDQPSPPPTTGPREIPKVLLKIPPKVIQNCVGLAIFTVMRTGLWVSGAAGSGVLIARKEDGSWSSPSGLLVHTLGVGVMAGIDIYDCVIVINNRSALDAFSKVRVSLGGEVSLAAGPLGVGGMVESEVMGDRTPVFSYVKSKGLYAGAQLDGTVIVERNDENRRFYGEELGVGEILRGGVERVPKETGLLMGVLREIDGRGGAVRRSVSVERKDEEVDEKIQDYVLPPEYEKVESMEDLYSPPSPRPIQGLSGGDLLFQHSPIQGSTKDLCLPSLPPRPSSQNDDVLISK